MNPRLYLYALSSFFLTFASGARDGLTTAGWVSLFAFSVGTAATAVVAYLDRSSGQPPQSTAPAKLVAAIVAIALALAVAGCVTFDVSTRLPSGTKIRAKTNGTGASIELSREF
jgi:uncharacterized membrane protein YjjP (DUF1212 family)